MKYVSLNWTLALKFSIGKKNRMRDCQILMAHDCRLHYIFAFNIKVLYFVVFPFPVHNVDKLCIF